MFTLLVKVFKGNSPELVGIACALFIPLIFVGLDAEIVDGVCNLAAQVATILAPVAIIAFGIALFGSLAVHAENVLETCFFFVLLGSLLYIITRCFRGIDAIAFPDSSFEVLLALGLTAILTGLRIAKARLEKESE